VERAVNRSIIIIPVRLEDVMPARSLEFFLSTSHWMDAFPPPFENHLENLSRTIHQIVFGSQVPFSHPKIPVTPWWQRHALTLAVFYSMQPGRHVLTAKLFHVPHYPCIFKNMHVPHIRKG
jgi:hypothetical protein